MSRIGRLPVAIPERVTVDIGKGNLVRVQGPEGALEQQLPPMIEISIEDGQVRVSRPNDEPKNRALHGLTRTLIANMVSGVASGYMKTLEIQGVGYRAQLQGESLSLQLGFSHPVVVHPPEGIAYTVEGNRIHVRGIDKQAVGQAAANIRALRPPEPYKGKGVRYADERVRRKAGKAGKR